MGAYRSILDLPETSTPRPRSGYEEKEKTSPVVVRRDSKGMLEDSYVHHAIGMRDSNGVPKNSIHATCGVKYGFHTDDIPTLLAHPNACPKCKQNHSEAQHEEMIERVRSKYRERED